MKELTEFLKDFPDKWILFILCILVGCMHFYFQVDFTSQLLNTVISALVGLLIGRSRSETTNQTTIDTNTVQTPSINNDQMNDAVINILPKEDLNS